MPVSYFRKIGRFLSKALRNQLEYVKASTPSLLLKISPAEKLVRNLRLHTTSSRFHYFLAINKYSFIETWLVFYRTF